MTASKTHDFWRDPSFYKDGHPLDILEVVEGRLGLQPSPKQEEILFELAGRDPYDWNVAHQVYVLAIGQGGGKNKMLIGPLILYLTYRLANMKNPWKYFERIIGHELHTSTRFELSNSSMVNDRQSRNVHFKNMQALVRAFTDGEGRNWFERYAHIDLRRGVGDIKRSEIIVPTFDGCGEIILHSFDSTPTAPEGLSLITGIVDEASRADTPAKYNDARELCAVIRGNVNTRFPKGVGKLIVFSYLNTSEFDYTQTLLEEAERERSEGLSKIMYAIRHASWETNPLISKSDPSIARDYRIDPTGAMARYECVKGSPKEGFYEPHTQKVRECFFEIPSPVQYRCVTKTREVRDPNSSTITGRNFSAIDITNIKGDTRIRGWAIDPAEKYDSFILKGGYVETMDEMKDELFIDNERELVVINKRPIIDIVIAWQPQSGLPVDFVNVGEVLGLMLQYFPNSRFVNSDKWNAVKLSQEVMSKGVASQTYGFGNPQQMRLYMKLRWMFWNNIPMIAYHTEHNLSRRGISKSIGEWNAEEHGHLLRINNRVDHPSNGAKDLADVDAILCNDLVKLEVSPFVGLQGPMKVSDPKIAPLVEKFLIERQRLRNANIPYAQQLSLIAVAMRMSKNDVAKIQQLVEETNW